MSKKTHGKTKTVEYTAWQRMKDRCYNPNSKYYKNYGGRGIQVCSQWLNDFEQFLADVGPKPYKDYSLERVDNNGNYEPDNVIWTDRYNQNINQRIRRDNSSGIRGVNWHKKRKHWQVRISVKGKRIEVGSFKEYQDAVNCRLEAEAKYWG